MGSLGTFPLRTLAAALAVAGASVAAHAGNVVLFEDNFDGAVISPAWKSIGNLQWAQNGWMHVRDTDGWPRDAGALVNDGSRTWTDYRLSMMADFVQTGPMPLDNMAIVLRTDGYWRQSGRSAGSAYQFEITGPRWSPDLADTIQFARVVDGQGAWMIRVPWLLPSHPFLVEAAATGNHIQFWIDHVPVFDLYDAQPLLYGGIGVHTIWETESRFDNVRVVGVPEPGTYAMLALGLGLAAAVRRRTG